MDSPLSPPPFTFDGQVIIKEGAFGKIHFGSLVDSGTPVCVKVCTSNENSTIVHEFELLKKLKGQDAIIQTYGFSDDSITRCLVLERADGSLEHLLNQPRHSEGLSMHTILKLVHDVGSALKSLFKEQIFDFDIKPKSILYFKNRETEEIGEQFSFKLCDLGSGPTTISPEATFETLADTMIYMNPDAISEYLRSDDPFDSEDIDLWSLGVTLYRCCTGEFPFDPRPFDALRLLRILLKRPENAIVYRNDNYYDEIKGVHTPVWFNEMMNKLIQLTFQQADAEMIAEFMLDISNLRPRMVFSVNESRFYEMLPRQEPNDPWFVENEEVGFTETARLCFLEGNSNDSWLQLRDPRCGINEVAGNFLILWDCSSKARIQIEELDYNSVNKSVEKIYASKSADESSASVLRIILLLKERMSNAFLLASTAAELSLALGNKDAEAKKETASAYYEDAKVKVHGYNVALIGLDDLKRDAGAEEQRKKELVAIAKHAAKECMREKQLLSKESASLARLLSMLLPHQGECRAFRDLQPMVRGLLLLKHQQQKQQQSRTSSASQAKSPAREETSGTTKSWFERKLLKFAEAAENLKTK